ncbi:chemotaxis protein CheW [Noviherbaspirillum sp. UKPF54]|uniref:chemotaxis protein CheW n=1 Tax=Noviherbaspirillum sp. UKPF54 TaxID=2601898 RepID=UPI00143D929E|nr:chemotaxis protein CheW [Noviherbaspirillum sp. UKPF54]
MHTNTYVSPPGSEPDTAMADAGCADYLTYRASGRQYGAPLHKVLELRRMDEVRPRHRGDAIIGTIMVHGIDVPVVDLPAMLGLSRPLQENNAEVVILHSGDCLIGIAAECVIDVTTLCAAQMRLAPAIRMEDGAHYLLGIGKIEQRVLALLDVDKLLADLHPLKFAA